MNDKITNCSDCGGVVSFNAKACPTCGAPPPVKPKLNTRICPDCTASIVEGSASCPGCGAPIASAQAGEKEDDLALTRSIIAPKRHPESSVSEVSPAVSASNSARNWGVGLIVTFGVSIILYLTVGKNYILQNPFAVTRDLVQLYEVWFYGSIAGSILGVLILIVGKY